MRWLPALLWMAAIFFFSSRREPLALAGPALQSSAFEHLIHAIEYFGLVILLHHALSPNRQVPAKAHRRHHVLAKGGRLSVVFASGYAVLDELHQEIVPGRSFELADLGYDMMGMVAAFTLIRWWIRIPRAIPVRTQRGAS